MLKDPRKIMFEKMAAEDLAKVQTGVNTQGPPMPKPPKPQAPKNPFLSASQQANQNVAQHDPLFFANTQGGAYSNKTLNRFSPAISKTLGMLGFPLKYHATRDVLPNMAEHDPTQYASDLTLSMNNLIPRSDGYTYGFASTTNGLWQDYLNGRANNWGGIGSGNLGNMP